MYMNRKFFAILLTVLIVCNIYSVDASIEDIGESAYEHAIKVVFGLGIMDSETLTNFYPEDELVRAEAVRYVMKLRNIDIASDGIQYFTDVPSDYYAFSEINKAVALGVVSGYNDRFHPERNITFSEAVKMILSVMNYDALANKMGGFPYGYLRIANERRLLTGIKYSTDASITRGQFAALIYNSFKVKIIEQYNVGDEVEYKQIEDKTSLSFLNLSVTYGVLNANDKTSLYTTSKPMSKGLIRIGAEDFENGKTDAYSHIGYNVEAYYTENNSKDIKELVFITQRMGKNDKIQIYSSDTDIEYLNGQLKCHGITNTKTYEISNIAAYIYNGTAVDFSPELYVFENGSITLLDNGTESGFNVVIINTYQNFVVDSVSVLQRKIFFRDKRYGEENFIELPDNNSKVHVSILKENKPVDISEIKTNNVVSIMKSTGYNTEIVTVHLSDKTITGKAEEYSFHDKTIVVDSAIYKIDNNCQIDSEFKVSENVELYINFEGIVVCIAVKKIWERNYAFVLAISEGVGLSEAQIKLIDIDGVIATYSISNKATVNNKSEDSSGEKYSGAKIAQMIDSMDPQLIVFELDSHQKIKNIDLAASPSGDILNDKGVFTLDHTISSSKRATNNYIDGIGTVTTRFFVIPPKEGNSYKEEDCVLKTNYLTVGRYYDDIKFYDVGQSGVAQVALIMDTDSLFFQEYLHNFFVVEKKAKIIDEEGETLTKVYGKSNGRNEEFVISPKATDAAWIYSYDIENISFGDIFVFEKDGKGRIGVYAVLYVDSLDKDTRSLGHSLGNGFDSGRDMQIFIGTVRYKSDEIITVSHVSSNFGFTLSPLYMNQTPEKYIVYIVNRKTGKIRIGDVSDITATNYNTSIWGDRIIARGNKYYFAEGVIFE